MKSILILCTGYPFACDRGFGYHVWKKLEKMVMDDLDRKPKSGKNKQGDEIQW